MAKINAINNKSQDLTLDPGSSGDSFIQFNINGTGEFRIGVDDDDSDKFKISQGSALGTNDTFVMTSTGERTMPLQSAFLAYNSSQDSNVTGDGTAYTVEFNTEIYDQNGDYDSSTDTFTAPVTGRYHLTVLVGFTGLTVGSHNAGTLDIVTSNRTYQGHNEDPGTGTFNQFGFSVLADMDATDTATCVLTISGHTLTVDVSAGTDMRTSISGTLIC